MQDTLTFFITDYINKRKVARLELFDKNEKKILATLLDQGDADVHIQDLKRERAEIEQKYELKTWLTDAATRAGQISLVTHALKFIHSDARGSSIFYAAENKSRDPAAAYLSTASLKKFR